jgi:hypothetical protein
MRSRRKGEGAHRKGVDGEVLAHWKSSARLLPWFSTAMAYTTVIRRSR